MRVSVRALAHLNIYILFIILLFSVLAGDEATYSSS